MPGLATALLMVASQIVGMVFAVCPITLPCHCLTDTVYCAYIGLHELPFFLDFKRTWNELNLSQNFLTALSTSAFDGVHVHNLNLVRNSIAVIDPGAFEGTSNIEVLDLSFNHLRGIPAGAFRSMNHLKVLKVRYNQIRTIAPSLFTGLSHLVELDLTGNELDSVPVAALQELKLLDRLILRGNHIKRVDKFSFHSLPLTYIDMGDNGDTFKITNGAFCGLDPRPVRQIPSVTEWVGLTTLILDHNGLSSLDPCISQLHWTLDVLDLSGNPLRCDCKILELRNNNDKIDYERSQCAKPELLAGIFIQEFSDAHLLCNQTRRKNTCTDTCRLAPTPHYQATSLTNSILYDIHLILAFTTSRILYLL